MHKLPKALINQILGHEPDKDETSQTYSQGYGIEELYEGIKNLDYGDIVFLGLIAYISCYFFIFG